MKKCFSKRLCDIFVGPIGHWGSCIFYILCPILSFYLLELLTHNPFADIHLGLHVFSWLVYLLFYTICFLITGRMSRGYSLATVLVAAVGVANYFVLEFRGSPILPWDVKSLGTALSVAGNQSFSLTTPVIAILCGFILLLYLSLRCRYTIPDSAGKRRAVGAAVSIALMAGVVLGLQTKTAINLLGIYEMPFTQGYTYRQNGFVVSYLMNTKYLSVDKPDSYSIEQLEESVACMEEARTDSEESQKPNIIVIMNEAFSDLSVLGDFETNKDYMPFFRSLSSNTISGTAYVSVLGGNTANSEFEFLTGDSMAFLPTGSIPYQQYIDSELPSLVNVLKDQGYYTIAMHPYYASGWDRDEVYDYLGFDEKCFLDDFKGCERLRQYVSDWGMYQKLIELYESKKDGEPLFFFGVTMQNHSGYSKEYANFTSDVHVTDGEYKWTDAYLSLIAQSDRAYERLIRYFAESDEDTIILMFGDHQPTALETGFFTEVLGKNPQELTLEETTLRYQTPFKIWANYDIEESEARNLSVNYLGTLLFQTAGLEVSEYQQYLWGMQETIPVITANFYINADGGIHDYSSETDVQLLLDDYSGLQYNHLFDTRNRLMTLFTLKPVQNAS